MRMPATPDEPILHLPAAFSRDGAREAFSAHPRRNSLQLTLQPFLFLLEVRHLWMPFREVL